MCSKNDLNIILSELAAAYKEVYGNDVVKILLYGSYARGDYDENSDVDIAAIVKGNREELQEKLKIIWERSQKLELEYETILSPVVIPYDEYKEYSYMLITGIRLYRQAGDQASAEICLRELKNTAEAVHTANKRLSSLGKKIKDQPTVRLPDDVEDYIKSEDDRQ